MKATHLAWTVAGVLLAAASIAIHYEVKVRMHQHFGSVNELGHLKVSEPAPDFTLRDLNGHAVTLSLFRGKAVYVAWVSLYALDFVAIMFLLSLWRFRTKELP